MVLAPDGRGSPRSAGQGGPALQSGSWTISVATLSRYLRTAPFEGTVCSGP
jgi:hypothetical protein